MIGISMDELRERLSWSHEAEFTYHDQEYVIQPEVDGDEVNIVIWKLTPEAYCICKHPIPADGQIPNPCIDAALNDKCFDGKSFMDIEADVIVDAIL